MSGAKKSGDGHRASLKIKNNKRKDRFMKLPTTKLQIVDIDPKKRILVTSDINGNLPYFKTLLDKAAF